MDPTIEKKHINVNLITPKYSNLMSNFMGKVISSPTDKINQINIINKLQSHLMDEINDGKHEANFQLGQIYFEKGNYEESIFYFKKGMDTIADFQCTFQMGVIYYDGLGVKPNPVLGCEYMKIIFNNRKNPLAEHLFYDAAYNLGRASYQGYGIRQSDEEAEKYWVLAADDGNPEASILAQTTLGYYYSLKDHLDLKKAFFWHTEACGNGSVESQASLGVLYLHGIGVNVDWGAALICLDNAAERGSIYAKGNLCFYFYRRMLYTKAADLSSQISQLEEKEIDMLSKQSGVIMNDYLRKGVSMACFIFARCLHLGLGVKMNREEAFKYYSKSFEWDEDLCYDFQNLANSNQL